MKKILKACVMQPPSQSTPLRSAPRPKKCQAQEICKGAQSSGVLGTQLRQALQAEGEAAVERATAIAHFCELFEVGTTPVRVVVEQVFHFVHELKLFLAVRLTQFARKVLGLDATTNVSAVLEAVCKQLVS